MPEPPAVPSLLEAVEAYREKWYAFLSDDKHGYPDDYPGLEDARSAMFAVAKEARHAVDQLAAIVRSLVAANPAFRLKRIGHEGSDARRRQEAQIAAEDEAVALLAATEAV